MTTDTLRIVYQTIVEVITDLEPGRRLPYIHPADDTEVGNGYTYKIHRTVGLNHIWPTVLGRLEKKGITWYRSALRYKDLKTKKEKIADWVGIRSVKH